MINHRIHHLSLLIRCALLLALASLATASQAVPEQSTPPKTVIVLGDSISAAYGMPAQEGWVALLQTTLADSDYRVVNASISGDTSGGGLARLPALLDTHSPAVVIVELGGNDGLRGYPIASLRKNLGRIIETSTDAGARVLLLGMQIPPNYGTRYTEQFYASYRELAQHHAVPLVEFLLQDIALDPTLMQADGIHPTAAAQPRILQNVLPALKPLLD